MFEIRERDGLARIGLLETGHGRVATPTLAPVVNPNRPIIPPGDLATRFGAQILITNAYILGKSPARDSIVRDGIHAFLGFPGAVMTDSGAFQSHVYGDVDVTNAEVVGFQKAIRTDFGTMLDVFSEPDHDSTRAAKDVDETIRRAQEAVSLRGDMALVGAVQGGLHPDLRERCARLVSSLDVAVCAIGGVVPLLEAYRFRDLVRVIVASKKGLDPSKPVHLFGAGHPLVFPIAALLGCDLFDSASYAKYARDGRMLFPDGTRRASDVRESGCLCPVCTAHPMEKIAAEETLLAEHNLHACFGAIREVRQAIGEGDLWGLAERRARAHPALLDAGRGRRRQVGMGPRPPRARSHLADVPDDCPGGPRRRGPRGGGGLLPRMGGRRRLFLRTPLGGRGDARRTPDPGPGWTDGRLERAANPGHGRLPVRARCRGCTLGRHHIVHRLEEYGEGSQRPRGWRTCSLFARGGRMVHVEGRGCPSSRTGLPPPEAPHCRRGGCRPVPPRREERLREVCTGCGSRDSSKGRGLGRLPGRRAVRGRAGDDEPSGDARLQARRRRARSGGRASRAVRSATLTQAR